MVPCSPLPESPHNHTRHLYLHVGVHEISLLSVEGATPK